MCCLLYEVGTMMGIMGRRTRRAGIFEFICTYAEKMGGPTPSISEVAQHFSMNYKTAYLHVMKLIYEGRLRHERGKLAVIDSPWRPPG